MRVMVGNKGKSKLERYVRIKKRLKKELRQKGRQ